jgi:hypothetical protein
VHYGRSGNVETLALSGFIPNVPGPEGSKSKYDMRFCRCFCGEESCARGDGLNSTHGLRRVPGRAQWGVRKGVGLVMTRMLNKVAYILRIGLLMLSGQIGVCTSAAFALEVIRDAGVSRLYPNRSELLLDDDPQRGAAGPVSCSSSIRPDFEVWLEANKFMFRLAEPFLKNGQSFEWRIGNRDGTTYWHRRQLGDGRSEISIYVPSEGLQLKLVAAYMTVNWARIEKITIDPDEYRTYGEALLSTPDLMLNLADSLNGEQLTIYYTSMLVGLEKGNWRTTIDKANRNIWISRIMKAAVRCQTK